MKKLITIATLVLGFTFSAMAQNNAYQSTLGFTTDASGAKSYISPSTIISVDVTIEKEDNIQTLSHNGSATEFAKILPDRLTNSALSLDDAALEAAQAIFDIRKHRIELITGEAGENVFGGGLKDALDALDKQENALLELFFGKNIITTTTERFYILVNADTKDYTIANFSKSAGLGQNGEAITLHITPSGKSRTVAYTEADPKAKALLPVRVADLSKCEVKIDGNVFPTKLSTLPIFEFGHTIYVTAPAEK